MRFIQMVFGLLAAAVTTGFAEEAPSISIESAATLRILSNPATVYDLQVSTNLEDWSTAELLEGTGGIIEKTVAARHAEFFRVAAEAYSALDALEIVSGGSTLTPEFNPGVHAYSFRKLEDEVELNAAFGGRVARARVNNKPVESGEAVRLTVSGYSDVILTLEGANGLAADYVLKPVPPEFPEILVTNHAPPDPEKVILTAARFPNNARGSWVMVIDNHGVPLWWKRIDLGLHLKLHENGLLSYAQLAGVNEEGRMLSENVVLDPFFNELFSVTPAGDYLNDLHDFVMTRRGTFYMLGYKFNTNELETASGTTNVYVKDDVIQEVSMADREVLFEWNTWGNVSYIDSKYPNKQDYAHLNYVVEDFDGNLLTSARGVSQAIKINKADGSVMWRLGGKSSDFTFVDDPLNGFGGQHDVYRLPNGNIAVFDNRNFISTNAVVASEGPSRVLEYKLDEEAKTATLVWSYSRPGFHSTSEGAAHHQENGDVLISWGKSTPLFATEVNREKKVRQDIRVLDDKGADMLGYHSYKVKKEEILGARETYMGGKRRLPLAGSD